ncbi:MAG TPA: hypothetical protein VHY48_01255 [Acidobacteriaceae bacterium]|jgi:hypothetical protein|nr:hypothetical protein [Acidobacteriaceae bacterium]
MDWERRLPPCDHGPNDWIEARRYAAAAATAVVLVFGLASAGAAQTLEAGTLPDAPSALLVRAADAQSDARRADPSADPKTQVTVQMPRRRHLRPCDYKAPGPASTPGASPPALQGPPPCYQENPIQPFISARYAKPLSSKEKGELAIRDFTNPFNFVTIAGYSAIAIAANAHSAYGPGIKGFARLTGYGLAQDAQGEFLETYAIPSLVREDPRYHRMPDAPFKWRLWHAIEHTYVSQHDDGRRMPNYATLLTYPITAEVSDGYVPGVQTDLKSTGKRVALGIATDPSGALVAEFLPDVAKRVHIHIVFVQEILNRMVVGPPTVAQ